MVFLSGESSQVFVCWKLGFHKRLTAESRVAGKGKEVGHAL